MSTTIKAIETRYAGCRFRSRLEARWAVFFDHLGIKWEYEPQGFNFSRRPYLPDFRLPGIKGSKAHHPDTWVEVKGDLNKLDYLLAAEAAGELGALLILSDIPRAGEWLPVHPLFSVVGDRRQDQQAEVVTIDSAAFVIQNGDRQLLRVSIGGCTDKSVFSCDGIDLKPADQVRDAYTAARSARFEHGESGAPMPPVIPAPTTPSAIDMLRETWDFLVGPELAAHTKPTDLYGKTLVIVADSTAWRTQVRLLRSDLIRRLNETLGPDVIKHVDEMVNTALWSKR